MNFDNLKFIFLIAFISTNMNFSMAQSTDELPYYEVPEYSGEFTAGTVAGRMVDALGFRFYWATRNLKPDNLNYKLNEDGRSTLETINHIYDLSKIIVNSTLKKPNSNSKKSKMTYEETRAATLRNLKTAADILRVSNDISEFKMIFGKQEVPFWNQVNGPIADSIWHCGQIASFRRASGNPINSKVNHFSGKVNN